MTATDPGKAGPSRSLATRIFLATALLVAVAVGLAVAVTSLVGRQVGDRAAREALSRSSSVQLQVQDDRLQQLRLIAYLVAGDPSFAAYIAEAIAYGDQESILDQLDQRREALGFDFAVVLDPDGTVVARTDDETAAGEDLSGEPLFLEVAEEFEATGVWARGDELYDAVAVPIVAAGVVEGYLIAAYAIDDDTALALREINNTEVGFLVRGSAGWEWTGRTLAPAAAAELRSVLADRPQLLGAGDVAGSAAAPIEVELEGRPWLALVRPLESGDGTPVGAVVHVASQEVQVEPFRRIGRTLLAVGALTVLLTLAVSYFLARRVSRPLHRLAAAAQAATEGDYDQQIALDRHDEVGRLAGAFDTLLSELRERRDMEIYVAELARTLPEPEVVVPEAAPAEERSVTLLGVELRRAPAVGGTPQEVLETLARELRRIARAVRTGTGKVEALLGHRLVASFEGPGRSDRALQAAAETVSRRPSGGGDPPVVVLVAGVVVSGTTTWDNRPWFTLTGDSMAHVEALLRVATPGSLLLSSSTRAELRTAFEEAGVRPTEHRSTVSEMPLFSVGAEHAGVLAETRHSATVRMSEGGTAADLPGSETLAGIGPGSVLGGRFEILAEIGAGGMGVVYKAHDRSLGELVALKMLRQEMWGDDARLERLKDELRLARKITHPNVLRTFDFGEADGFPFISMELVRGVTLKQLIDRSGRLPLSAGLRTARQLCRGLLAAHQQGVLHRDIKPENLIIEPNGNVKLMDFGIARPRQRLKPGQTSAGAIVGTPYYLAPEQLEGGETDERADLYASGVVLNEIFTGRLPFPPSNNVLEVITRKLQEPPIPPHEQWPEIPNALERIILRCLERDPTRRFPDVQALLDELELMRA